MKIKSGLILSSLLCAFTMNAQWWDITEPERLGGAVNSYAEESMPIFSRDSSILYFVRTFDANNTGGETDQDIWYSVRDKDSVYGEAKQINNLNNKLNNAVFGISNDGQRIYMLNSYDGKKDLEKGIAVSEKKKGSWSTPKKVEIPTLDIEGDFYGFHINGTEDIIIISYKGPGSLGEEDLYVSTKTNGNWSIPMHMGDVINTKGYEISPFLNKGADTLFFSSNGHGGFGEADIFYSVKQGAWNAWSKPVNLGDKINSPKFDAYFIISGEQMYWSSNRAGQRSDIYLASKVPVPPLMLSCSGIDATVFGKADGSANAVTKGGVAPFTYKWSNGATTQKATLLAKGEYTVLVTDAKGQTAECTVTIGEPLPPQDITMKHFFEYNADKLTVEEGKLKDFVNKVEKMVGAGRETIIISITSSASFVPTRTFGTNERLAKSRAEKMKKELEQYFAKANVKVKVEVAASVVAGPKYEGDHENVEKYRDFQFIELKTK
jgi:hypothetical protein